MIQKNREGFGTVTVGIVPNTFEVLIGHPNKIPTDKLLGGVVQNLSATLWSKGFDVGPQRNSTLLYPVC